MFVRKKNNPSGIISIQVIDKSSGKYRVVKTIGSSSDARVVDSLYQEGKQWISDFLGEQDIFNVYDKELEEQWLYRSKCATRTGANYANRKFLKPPAEAYTLCTPIDYAKPPPHPAKMHRRKKVTVVCWI